MGRPGYEANLADFLHTFKPLRLFIASFSSQAINFLHECGVLLHYNDVQTKLSDLYFLNPEWLCMLMGQIITIKQVNAFTKDGVSLLLCLLYKHTALDIISDLFCS